MKNNLCAKYILMYKNVVRTPSVVKEKRGS
jgi:hypothetical protein